MMDRDRRLKAMIFSKPFVYLKIPNCQQAAFALPRAILKWKMFPNFWVREMRHD